MNFLIVSFIQEMQKQKCLESNKILGKVFSVDNQLVRLQHRSARLHYQPVRYQVKRASGGPIFLSCGPSNKEWMSSVMHWQPYSFQGDKNLVQMNLYSSFELQPRSYITELSLYLDRNYSFLSNFRTRFDRFFT